MISCQISSLDQAPQLQYPSFSGYLLNMLKLRPQEKKHGNHDESTSSTMGCFSFLLIFGYPAFSPTTTVTYTVTLLVHGKLSGHHLAQILGNLPESHGKALQGTNLVAHPNRQGRG